MPRLTGPVVDEAGMISGQTRARLELFLRRVHEGGGPQINVATVPELGGLSIEEAAIKITDQWKLGDAKTDRGVLMLIARQERAVRIEVGYGLQGDLPDAVASRIIREIVIPRFKAGDVDRGVIDGVLAIVHYTAPDMLNGENQAPGEEEGPARGPGGERLIFWIFMFVVLVFFFSGRGRGGGSGFLLGTVLGSMGRGRGGFGGGFGGGGGWSGGGGGFGGGGASGNW